jgi:N-acetylneuraminic acid mutarotase
MKKKCLILISVVFLLLTVPSMTNGMKDFSSDSIGLSINSVEVSKGWKELKPSIAPPIRLHTWGHTAYDVESDRIILFGGEDQSFEYLEDTWAFDYNTNTWEDLTTLEMKGHGRVLSAVAYDEESDRIIMFGGTDEHYYPEAGPGPGETWSYDYNTNNWTEMTPSNSPPARAEHSMCYDSINDRIIMYGGFDLLKYENNQTFFDDTWAYDYNTNTWTEMSPSTSPPPQSTNWLAFDSESGKVVFFGGRLFASDEASPPPGMTHHETWVYDYSKNTWSNMTTLTHPPRRCIGMLTYNSRIDRICLYGGAIDRKTAYNDTWYYNYNENSWIQINTTTNPGERLANTLNYDSESDVVILFGGRPGDTDTPVEAYLDETWAFHSPIDIPTAPINLQAVLLDNNSVSLTWNPPLTVVDPPITSYKIFRGNESGVLIHLEVVESLSYIDNSVNQNKSYFYAIKASNSLGDGDFSNEISVTIPLAPTSSTTNFSIFFMFLAIMSFVIKRRKYKLMS